MKTEVDHYGAQYTHFTYDVYKDIRLETYGEDIGQNGWITAGEQDIFIDWLDLHEGDHLLDIACGSGGPALRIAEKTGCTVTGIDIHEAGIKAAKSQAESGSMSDKATFMVVDADRNLPFEGETFDAVICINAINHLKNRVGVFSEWKRVLKPKGKLVFTDPITVTGILSKEDIDIRASIGYFLFVADGVNEKLLDMAGFRILDKVDRTGNMALTAINWQTARQKHADYLLQAEGRDFEGQQKFLNKCAELAKNRSLSRFAYLAVKS